MVRNEISFPLADGEIAPAPSSPEGGLANVVETPTLPANSAVVSGRIVEEPAALAQSGRPVQQASKTEDANNRKTKRLHADTPFVLGLLLALIAALAAASFYVSFSGLYAAAAWAVGDNPPLQFAVPIMLDVAIVAFTIALFVERERGEKVAWTWVSIGLFAAVSAYSNVLHTLVVSTAVNFPQLLVGAIISGGAPILLAFATDKIAVKVFRSTKSDK